MGGGTPAHRRKNMAKEIKNERARETPDLHQEAESPGKGDGGEEGLL